MNIPRRSWLVLAGLWLLLSAGVILWAGLLDGSVGEGPRDSSQPRQITVDSGDAPTAGSLPPLGLVLNRPLRGEINSIAENANSARLRQIAATSEDPVLLVEVGVVYQRWQDNAAAAAAFQSALERSPGHSEAEIGLVLATAAAPGGDLDAADRRLAERQNDPDSRQLTVFSRAWLALYRQDFDAALAGFRATIDIDPETRLGNFSTQLIEAIDAQLNADPPEGGG